MSTKPNVKSNVKPNIKSNAKPTITAQEKVANEYRDKGWDVSQPKGATDLKCSKGSVTHYVKVDKSDKPNTSDLSNKSVGVLKMTATKNNATSVIAKVDKDGNTNVKYAKINKSIF